MSRQQKVVWFEGMSLDPHHFQQWDRYVQSTLNARVRAVAPFYWGLAELEIDREALANGLFAVKRGRGVTDDGLPFDFAEKDPEAPQPRAFNKIFPANENKLAVFLAIPVERPNQSNCQSENETARRPARFIRRSIEMPDDITGREERAIEVARPNIQLRFGVPDEPLGEYSTLKIAEVKLGDKNSFELVAEFIPPSLSLAASQRLVEIGKKLLSKLIAKSDSLMGRRQLQTSGRIEFTSTEVTKFWLLHTVNTFIPWLSHLLAIRSHPESLHAMMVALAGQLTTFSASDDVRPSTLPAYDHDNPTPGFNQLYDDIDRLLELAISDRTVDILLAEKQKNILWDGRITEPGLIQSAQFVLVFYTDLPDHKVMEELPRRIKITSTDKIHELIAAAVPGLNVVYTQQAPPGRTKRPGVLHFNLEKNGKHWEAIARTGTIAIHCSAELKATKVELVAVKESG